MKIDLIEFFHVEVPLKDTFWPAYIPGYPMTHNRFTLLKLVTDDGIEGYSAVPAVGQERQGLGEAIAPFLLNADPTDMNRVQDLLTMQAVVLGWKNYWMEAAFWDILGKKEGKPVYELLGGNARAVPVYLSTGEHHEPEQRAEEILAIHESGGYKMVKLRAKNMELKDDIRLIEGVRKGVGDNIAIAVDANQGWVTSIVQPVPVWDLKRAMEFAKACEDNQIEWLEEPLYYHDYDGNAALKKASKVKIAGAEINYGWSDIKIMFEKDCFDIYQPDAVFSGGISQVMKVIQACRENDRLFAPHAWSTGIGFRISWNMKLVEERSSIPLEFPNEPPAWVPEEIGGIIDPVYPDKDGMLQPFTEPGLGFEIDQKKLETYGECFFTLKA